MKNNYFTILKAILLTIAFQFNGNAQTILVAGDIAITGFIGNGTVAGDDQFSFVLLRNITSGTVINFTDNGWLRTSATVGTWRTGEGIATWTAQSALSAGTEIKIVCTPTMTTTTRLPITGAAGTAGTVTGTALSLSANGDTVTAYQGTEASPIFITAAQTNVYIGQVGEPISTAAEWDGSYNNATASGLPTGLTTGVNAFWLGIQGDLSSEKDNARFNCGTFDLSSVAKIKALIFNRDNWISNDNAPNFTLPTNCGYMDPALTTLNIELNSKVSLYPNPFSNSINIDTSLDLNSIEMYNVLGKKVYSSQVTKSINTINLNSGVYLLKLKMIDGQEIIKKIIKN